MANNITRRSFVEVLGSLFSLSLMGKSASAFADVGASSVTLPVPRTSSGAYVPVNAIGVPTCPYTTSGGIKEFRLTAEPITITFPDGSDPHMTKRRPVYVWGYNGSMPGPTIEVIEGDTVRIVLKNNLPESTTIHWHGIELPIEMDGVPDISQKPVKPGETFVYEFTIRQPAGTFFYHSHQNTAKQVGLGMMGFFIIHPRSPRPDQIVDRDYAIMLHTWKIDPGSPIPNTLEMTDFNYFTMNGRVGEGPGSKYGVPDMQARIGEKVRIRVSNLSMLVHPFHIHGHQFKITDLGGGFLPPHQHMVANTVNVSAAEVRGVEFVAKYPGKWMAHCHFTHHTMNDMHRPPLPGDPPMEDMPMMDMGGMSTIIDIT
jgi:FtsP/CotA-like multicopper oxidase with cupredoxin domain